MLVTLVVQNIENSKFWKIYYFMLGAENNILSGLIMHCWTQSILNDQHCFSMLVELCDRKSKESSIEFGSLKKKNVLITNQSFIYFLLFVNLIYPLTIFLALLLMTRTSLYHLDKPFKIYGKQGSWDLRMSMHKQVWYCWYCQKYMHMLRVSSPKKSSHDGGIEQKLIYCIMMQLILLIF